MKYHGYKTKEEIIALTEEAFPYTEKPEDDELMYFGNEDIVSKFVKEHMASYKEAKLPVEAVRYLHSELVNLSAKGMGWLFPSLLRCAIHTKVPHDTLHEFIVYDLEYSEERKTSILSRYSFMSQRQLECMACILEYFSETHGHSISLALQSLEVLSA